MTMGIMQIILLAGVKGQVGSALAPLLQEKEQPRDVLKPATNRPGFDG